MALPLRRRPLRVRLSVLAVVLVALGLLASGLATRQELRSFLIDRVDAQFRPAVGPVLHALGDGDEGALREAAGSLPPHSYFAVLSSGGSIVVHRSLGYAPADLSEHLGSAPDGISTLHGYRVDVTPGDQLGPDGGEAPLPPGSRLAIAIPLADVNGTLDRLALLELLVGLIVTGGVALVAYALVRRELRPLERIEDTAAAIAAGDLSRRVETAERGTEVGSLAHSLNAMLAQIERAFEERRRSEERLRRFVADASHELRTPLTSVRGYAELFRRGAAARPDDLALAMDRIESEAARMGVLVDDLLLLASLDQGRPLAREAIDLGPLLAEMVSDHTLLHPDWPISLAAEGDGRLRGDELRIRQAVGNLLANARAHTPPGTELVVRLSSGSDERLVDVEDHGPGIPDAMRGHVFERFFRADPSRARASGGSGLGLAIVAGIAEAHGGRAEALETPGGGLTVRIVLPAAGAAPAEDASAGLDVSTGHLGPSA